MYITVQPMILTIQDVLRCFRKRRGGVQLRCGGHMKGLTKAGEESVDVRRGEEGAAEV